jgi:hypothetical protein
MKFFWFKRFNNYGDVLTPYICRKLQISCEFANLDRAEGLMVGSIAALARRGMRVYGSGFIRRDDTIYHGAKYIWMRGPISRKMIIDAGLYAPEVYGDAALIMPHILKPAEKVHDYGFIPHHVEYESFPDVERINLTQGSIQSITRQITQCRAIISSSLHGIIIAHAYGIPAAWVKLSNKLTGDDMKFYDHYESVGLKAVLSTRENPVFQVPTEINTSHIKELLCSR